MLEIKSNSEKQQKAAIQPIAGLFNLIGRTYVQTVEGKSERIAKPDELNFSTGERKAQTGIASETQENRQD